MRGAERAFRRVLLGVLSDPVYAWAPGTRVDGDLPSDPRVLVVRTDRIGDALISTPLLGRLRERFPRARIDILLGGKNESVGPLLPGVDGHDVLRKKGAIGTIRALRRRRYDLLLNLQLKPSVNATLVCRLLGAGRILEYPLRTPFENPPASSRHMVSMTSRLLEPLGIGAIQDGQCELFSLQVVVPEKSLSAGRRACAELSAQLPDPGSSEAKIFINLSAGSRVRGPAKPALTRRIWPFERSVDLATRLRKAGFTPILCSAPEDADLLRRAAAASRGAALVLPTTDSYADFAGLLAQADLVVSPDTSTTHLAAALGRPVVALFHKRGNGLVWGPWGTRCRQVASPEGIAAIEASEVFRVVVELLGETRAA